MKRSRNSVLAKLRLRKDHPLRSHVIDGYKPIPVVGIGASAGGLESFSLLFNELPSDIGMAFVLIQRLVSNDLNFFNFTFS